MRTKARLVLLSIVLVLAACKGRSCGGPPQPSSIPPAPHGLEVSFRARGVTFTTSHGLIGESCAPDGDGGGAVTIPLDADSTKEGFFNAIKRCARTLKQTDLSLAKDRRARIDASLETRYGDVIDLIDAVRQDEQGELFPDYDFVLPKAPTRSADSGRALPSSSSTAPLAAPSGSSQQLVTAEEGAAVILSRAKIIVDDELVLSVPNLIDARATGLPREAKRGGDADPFITSVGSALERSRSRMKTPADFMAMLIADPNVSYGVVREVLYTFAESDVRRYHLLVLQGAK